MTDTKQPRAGFTASPVKGYSKAENAARKEAGKPNLPAYEGTLRTPKGRSYPFAAFVNETDKGDVFSLVLKSCSNLSPAEAAERHLQGAPAVDKPEASRVEAGRGALWMNDKAGQVSPETEKPNPDRFGQVLTEDGEHLRVDMWNKTNKKNGAHYIAGEVKDFGQEL